MAASVCGCLWSRILDQAHQNFIILVLVKQYKNVFGMKQFLRKCFFSLFWFRSSHQRRSIRKGALRNFTKFTRKHLRQRLFLNKVAGSGKVQVVSCEFCEISNTFFTEHLWTTASFDFCLKDVERKRLMSCYRFLVWFILTSTLGWLFRLSEKE